MSSPIIDAKVYRCTYDGSRIEDITDAFLDCSVVMDPQNDQTWSLDAAMTFAAYDELRPFLDWIAPELTITYLDGTVRRGQLGLYFVLESPSTRNEITGTVHLQAEDPLWLVARQELDGLFHVAAGTGKDIAVRRLLDGAVLTEGAQGQRYAIPGTDRRFRKSHEWDKDQNRLEIANDILHGYGCYPLWSRKHGILTSKRLGEARLRHREPVRTYSANLPAGVFLAAHQQPLGGMPSEIVGDIETTPSNQDLLNQALMVNDDPEYPRVYVKRRVDNPDNPRNALRGKDRRHTKKRHLRTVEDDATAQEVADALLDELSTHNETIRFSALPDPVPEFARETINVFAYDRSGDAVANGHYAIHRIEYHFSADDGLMTIDCGRIDAADGALETAP